MSGLSLIERWREASKEARPKWSGGPHCKCDACATVCGDAAVAVVLEHLIDESGVLCIPDVAAAYMGKLLEEIQ